MFILCAARDFFVIYGQQRRFMKKFTAIISAIIALMMIFAFTACTPSSDSSSLEQTSASDSSVPKTDYSTKEYSVYVPSGAPSLAAAQLIAENNQFGRKKITYNVVSATEIGSKIKLDQNSVGVLPVNAASKLFGDGETCSMLGVVTHGNLYIVSKDENVTTLADLIGKQVYVVGQNNFMDYTFQMLLQKNNVAFDKTTDGVVEDKVTVKYVDVATTAVAALVQGQATVALLPEPVASNAKANAKAAIKSTLDLQAIYGGGYPQAVLVAQNSVIQDSEFITAFTNALTANETYLKSEENIQTAVSSINELSAEKLPATLNADIVSRLAIKFSWASDEKQKVVDYIALFKALNANAVGDMADKFFYSK